MLDDLSVKISAPAEPELGWKSQYLIALCLARKSGSQLQAAISGT